MRKRHKKKIFNIRKEKRIIELLYDYAQSVIRAASVTFPESIPYLAASARKAYELNSVSRHRFKDSTRKGGAVVTPSISQSEHLGTLTVSHPK